MVLSLQITSFEVKMLRCSSSSSLLCLGTTSLQLTFHIIQLPGQLLFQLQKKRAEKMKA